MVCVQVRCERSRIKLSVVKYVCEVISSISSKHISFIIMLPMLITRCKSYVVFHFHSFEITLKDIKAVLVHLGVDRMGEGNMTERTFPF